jgi:hypothetical protein
VRLDERLVRVRALGHFLERGLAHEVIEQRALSLRLRMARPFFQGWPLMPRLKFGNGPIECDPLVDQARICDLKDLIGLLNPCDLTRDRRAFLTDRRKDGLVVQPLPLEVGGLGLSNCSAEA